MASLGAGRSGAPAGGGRLRSRGAAARAALAAASRLAASVHEASSSRACARAARAARVWARRAVASCAPCSRARRRLAFRKSASSWSVAERAGSSAKWRGTASPLDQSVTESEVEPRGAVRAAAASQGAFSASASVRPIFARSPSIAASRRASRASARSTARQRAVRRSSVPRLAICASAWAAVSRHARRSASEACAREDSPSSGVAPCRRVTRPPRAASRAGSPVASVRETCPAPRPTTLEPTSAVARSMGTPGGTRPPNAARRSSGLTTIARWSPGRAATRTTQLAPGTRTFRRARRSERSASCTIAKVAPVAGLPVGASTPWV